MKATLAVLAAVVAIGIAMARVADRFFPSLNDPAPALASRPRFEGAASPRLARKVVFVIVDGLRYDASRGLPWLDRVRARGIDAHGRALFPTISKASYVTMLTGVPPRFSGARTNDRFLPVALDSVVARVVAAGGSAGYVADRTKGIARLFAIEDAVATPTEKDFIEAFEQAYQRDDLVILFWIDVDRVGHSAGGTSDRYRAAVRDVDGLLGRTLAKVDLARDAIVVTGDHGHTVRGGHGGTGADVEDVPLVLAGAGVRVGVAVEGATHVDLAPTLAALLGVPAPGYATGRTLVEALATTPAHHEALVAADRDRAAHLAPILRGLDDDDVERYRRGRVWRAIVAAVGLGCLGGLIVLAARRRWLIIDRVALAGLVFPLVYYASLFGIDHLRGGWPNVPGGRVGLWGVHVMYGGLATVALLMASWVALRRRPDRIASANGAVLVGLLAIAAPAMSAWALAGPTLATMLPSAELLMITPAACMGAAFYAVGASIVLVGAQLARRRD